jgi:hypothetical protein
MASMWFSLLCLPTFVFPVVAGEDDVWLIYTTVAPPTEAVFGWTKLGWQVVGVADLKTPEDGHLELEAKESNYHFLTVAEQNALEKRFPSLRHVGWKAYQRKQAGYLYAIASGAKVIYETDDDNVPLRAGADMLLPPRMAGGTLDEPAPIEKDGDVGIELSTGYQGLSALNLTNAYGCFGRSELWPRGFPLSHLQWFVADGGTEPIAACTRTQVDHEVWAPVQQSLQDKDPDVDGIYRLTNAARIRAGIDFGRGRPLALPRGQVCPYNTQNTAIYYEAFWGLVLPLGVTFRECDIVRGWWVQRVLWEIGARLLFRESTVRHDRNNHNYYADFVLEKKLYYEANPFLNFLLEWKSDLPTLDGRIRNLAEGLAAADLWPAINVALMADWIQDLKALNYTFPAVIQHADGTRAEL